MARIRRAASLLRAQESEEQSEVPAHVAGDQEILTHVLMAVSASRRAVPGLASKNRT
jgi:hypothetical protein